NMPNECLGDGDEKDSGGGRLGELNPSFADDEEHKRKVSISTSPTTNTSLERKVSQASSGGKPKSILVNGDNLSLQQSVLSEQPGKYSPYSYPGDRKSSLYEQEEAIEDTWWYLFCTKCRRKETGPGWEPPHYQLFCPYPFCPTYRHIARVISLIIIGLLAWGVIYLLFGADAAPGGQLFGIAALCIAANFGGWVFRMINLPPLVGMLLIGAIFQNLGYINVSGAYTHFASILRKIALVLILTRAGLDLDGKAMKKLAVTVLKTSLVPWMVEASVVMLLSVWLFGLPWMWGILLGIVFLAQAALAPVAMELVHDRTQEERDYAAILLLVVVMSIVLTAPLGAIIITFTGKRLLTKTEEPIMTEGWRRSARPSLRDISIINEEPDPDYEIRRKPSIVVNQASP
ncbi:unnamed protein product, partial [Nesidiocoris tenuis]